MAATNWSYSKTRDCAAINVVGSNRLFCAIIDSKIGATVIKVGSGVRFPWFLEEIE